MTATKKLSADATATNKDWQSIDWKACLIAVKRLQLRIARAAKTGNHRKVNALQWLLTHSFTATCLAVKRITQNKGHRTPGVDKKLLSSPEEKWQMIDNLKRRGYKSLPLRRIYIEKSNGKLRPLGIPSMRDRAMQALYTLALLPVSEMSADPNSYGFRPERGTAMPPEQLFCCLCRKKSHKWILEGDIKACFDKISHEWLLTNIPIDKMILGKWLCAGYMEAYKLFPISEGTPQGGLASPTRANMALDGVEERLRSARLGNDGVHRLRNRNSVNLIRYADDFVVTARTKEILEQQVKPLIVSFLKERGLELSEEKTKVTSI